MIARWFSPAFVLALPLLANAQAVTAPRAQWSTAVPDHSRDDGPLVRVWIPGTWNFRFAEPVPVSFEVSEASHVALFRVDGHGRLTVLWPLRNSLQTAARAEREYRVTGPSSSYAAFHADYAYGHGMVIAIASYDPIDLTAFRRYRNDASFYRYASGQRLYIGGVRHVVNRITQEILYAPDSPYDYDIAFYSVAGRSIFSNAGYANCDYDYFGYPVSGYRRAYWALLDGAPLGEWDDCYRSAYFRNYWAYCYGWSVFYSAYGPSGCRFENPNWPGGQPIGGTPQPGQPQPNTGMIDTIIARPVATTGGTGSTGAGATGGTTHIVRMDPVRDPPNVTHWLPDDESEALSIPRLRRNRDDSRTGRPVNIRAEGFPRSPGTGIRVGEPRAGDQPPERSPGNAFMPPVRESPRPVVWRDIDRDRGNSYTGTQRWERPVSSEPRHPSSGSGSIDRGQTSSGSGSSASPGPAVMPPRTDATVTKSSETKSGDAKASGERRPPPPQ